MKKRKIVKVVLIIIFLIIVLIDLFFWYFYACFSSSMIEGISYLYNSRDFYKTEYYNTSDISLHLSKYYYHKGAGRRKIKDMNYTLVEDNNEKIKNHVSTFLNKLYNQIILI